MERSCSKLADDELKLWVERQGLVIPATRDGTSNVEAGTEMAEDPNEIAEKEGGGAIPVPAKASIPVVSLMISVIASVMVATGLMGGGLYWAVKTNHLPLAGGTKAEATAVPEPAKTKLVSLEPLLVNLADPDMRSYLRIALTLKVDDSPANRDGRAKGERETKTSTKNEFDAEERDAALSILGKETGADLLAPDGKERLKRDLEAELKVRVPEVKVLDVLITEFLVQR